MEANKLHLIRARVPSPFGWTFVPGGQRVLWRGTVLVQLVSPLVEGWPFPRSWSVVYNSARKDPAAV